MYLTRYRVHILAAFGLLTALSIFFALRVRLSFDLEQFFPSGDPDLEFFKTFVAEFETDDNFLLVAVERREGVFEQAFLQKFHDFSLKARDLPHVTQAVSLTSISYPLKTPFALTAIPAIHLDEPARYARDRARILEDERFVNTLINERGTALVVFLKNVPSLELEQSRELMAALDSLVQGYGFEDYHYLGRPNFQTQLVAAQKREFLLATGVSIVLVTFILFLIFRRFWGVLIALVSIGLGMLLFLGFMGATGRELSAMAALYPVLMIIVGTSDVIHVMSKYVDELKKGRPQQEAISITIGEIGIATLLTSLTTAIGFLSLLSSRVPPIREFGLNAAVGVMIAYATVLLFTSALLSWFRHEQILKLGRGQQFWDRLMAQTYVFTKVRERGIALGLLLTLGLCAWGISRVTTNYSIADNLPQREKVTQDYFFFEKEFAGFRPLEFAVTAKNGYGAEDFAVLQQIDSLEKHLRSYPYIRSVNSLTSVYKTFHRVFNGNRAEAYAMPPDEATYAKYRRYADRFMENQGMAVLLSRDGTKTRISARILDIGSDTVRAAGERIDAWVASHLDSSIVEVRRTGTGVLFDKNEEYVRSSLVWGLGVAVLVVGVLMGLLFRNWRMVIISLLPNILPLLIAGALLGFGGIELEAGIAIIFSIIFGIAVDDTIHFLGRYKLSRMQGMDMEAALRASFLETGKAIVLTTIILFFGFLVLLFSAATAANKVGLIISVTLFSALFADLLLLPVLIRWLGKK